MPKLLIIGATGKLGRELEIACALDGRPACVVGGRADLDIADSAKVNEILAAEAPDVVINAAAYNDVDGAESDPAAADRANRLGPANLAEACKRIEALLVHFSTDYVFDGLAGKPYRVTDPPHPLNAYGRSKLAGERAVVDSACRHLLIRTSWVYSAAGGFVPTVLERMRAGGALQVVDDQHGRPTYAADLARMVLALVDREARGLYHASNEGRCTWHELAVAAGELAGLDCEVRPCATRDYPLPARRPAFSVLDLSATSELIGPPRPWREALADCIAAMNDPGRGRGPVTSGRRQCR